MTTPTVLPDGKGIAIELLSADLDGVHVSSALPEGAALNSVLPAVRVLRVGGLTGMHSWNGPAVRDSPRLSVDCYAADEAAAMQLALRVLAAWELLPNRVTAAGEVEAISQETGPQDRPEDLNSDVSRVGMILGMSVRPPRVTS